MKQSYWYKRHEAITAECRKELEKETAALEAIRLSEVECKMMEDLEAAQAEVKATVNAARRTAQKALEGIKQKLIGPRWFAVEKELWPKFKRVSQEIAILRRELAALEEPQRDVEPALEVLERLGFLDRETLKLTDLGTMASEVNEGHPILMSLWFQLGEARKSLATPETVLAVLAAFLGESKTGDASPLPDSLDVPAEVVGALRELQRMSLECLKVEADLRVPIPVTKGNYWELNFGWVEPVWRWVNGATLSELTEAYGLFEGNFVRVLGKLGNILEEWRVLAILAADTETLTLLADVDLRLGAFNESLYLRL